jgi:protein-S-isoprenylcysteine O-methyltransferase Ste14
MMKKNSIQKLASPVLMWAIIISGAAAAFVLLPSRRVLPSFRVFQPGALLLLYWAYMFFSAARIHREAPKSAGGISHIVTTGIYARVRHPIYSGDIAGAWGIFLLWTDLRVLASALWLTLVMAAWMYLEENALAARFGREYRDYRKQVPMAIPRL